MPPKLKKVRSVNIEIISQNFNIDRQYWYYTTVRGRVRNCTRMNTQLCVKNRLTQYATVRKCTRFW